MDKLRALEYFAAAAEEQSLSGAARRFDVSITAVGKMITALERNLGAILFERSSQGLVLTTDGARYLESCQPLLRQLIEADDSMRSAASKPRGALVVGAPAFVLQGCLGPEMLRFHARYPDIELDFRIVNQITDLDAVGADVFVLFGWHETPDFIQKPVAHSNYLVVATPAYWNRHGMPKRPMDLEKLQCFPFRNPRGVLLDIWDFERKGKTESVRARGWLASSHRELLIDAVLADEGVTRVSDLASGHLVRSGRLQAALQDWHGLHAPPANVLFRPNHRRTPKVRVFVDFVGEIFRKLRAEHAEAIPAERPQWYGTRHGKASAARHASTV
jgi:LysR family transcriptional regulator, regulator for bpeEF and oprC